MLKWFVLIYWYIIVLSVYVKSKELNKHGTSRSYQFNSGNTHVLSDLYVPNGVEWQI